MEVRQIILKFKGKMSVKCDPSQGLELYQLILRQILTIVPYIIILDRISTLKLKNLAHFSLNYLGKGHSGSKTGKRKNSRLEISLLAILISSNFQPFGL